MNPYGKIRYEFANEARSALRAVTKKGRSLKAGKTRGPLEVYLCPHCDAWHIGHNYIKARVNKFGKA